MSLYELSKRSLDVAVSGAGLLALSPLLATISGAIVLTSGRPVLFCQERPGKNGQSFMLYKFRTMRATREGEAMLASDADRLTGLGKLLRSTSLDELPTLWNVFRGDMSLVGPRPLLMRYLERYSPEQARRHEVRPGITGWAQVNGRNAISWEDKFDLDVWYVDHRSFLLDLEILLRTAKTVLVREGITDGQAATMHEFMGSPPRQGAEG